MASLWRPGKRRVHKELAAQVHERRKEGLAVAAKAVADSISEMGTVEKAQALGVGLSSMPSWNNLGNSAMNQSLISKVTNNLGKQYEATPEEVETALANAGLTWGPPFPPGRPLDPFQGYRTSPRTMDYTVGENTQLTPRWDRVSFPTLKALYDAYDVAQICVRHLINDLRSLDYTWAPARGVKEDVGADIQIAEAFFDSPDGRQPFENWLAEWLQDILRYDAGTLYVRTSNDEMPYALEVVDGRTIIPLVDYYGRPPLDTDEDDGSARTDGDAVTPAFAQIVQGMPWTWLTADDLIYTPWNPLPESQYGLAPLEAVLLSANTDVRFQWHFLQFFTEGTLPAGFMEAPPDMSDPTQLADWENNWNAVMLGDQAKLRQIRWVPAGAKFTAAKADADRFTSEFPLYLMRRTCASFGVTPADLGFTEDVNKASGDTQVDIQFRVGTRPLLKHIQALINLFIAKRLNLRCRLQFDDGQEVEDRVATAQAHSIYIDSGVESPDEVRGTLGLPIDKDNPVPRYINNAKLGPQPLAQIIASSGMVDQETFAPTEDAIQAERDKAAATAAAAAAGQQIGVAQQAQTLDHQADNHDLHMQQSQQEPAGTPDTSTQAPDAKADQAASGDTTPPATANMPPPPPLPKVEAHTEGKDTVDATTAVEKAEPGSRVIKGALEGTVIGLGIVAWDDDTISPGDGAALTGEVARVSWEKTLQLLDRLEKEGPTAGVTSSTGISGVDLGSDEDDDEDDVDVAKQQMELGLSLRRWKRNTMNRLKKGQAPKLFIDPTLPDEVRDAIWGELHGQRDLAKAVQTFEAADKAMAQWLDFTRGY